jgi:RAMA domain-containing protein
MVGTYAVAISRIERNEIRPSSKLVRAIRESLESQPDATDEVRGLRKSIPQLSDAQWLRQKLIVDDQTYQQVAEEVGCSRQWVHQKARQLGLLRPRRVARAGKRPKRVPRRIPLKGLLKDKRLRGVFAGKRFVARVLPSGAIKRIDTGELFDTPSQAARSVCRRYANGWSFWRYKDTEGVWTPLQALREQQAAGQV